MKTNSTDIADFYHQLALLIKSDLPLPDSLRQLGRYFPKRDFNRAISEISQRASKGEKFSDVIRNYPQFFSPFHAQLISAGEDAGNLPDILFAVARLARFENMLASKLRDVLAYPMVTFHLCLIIFMLLSIFALPHFHSLFQDMLGDYGQIPVITRMVLNASMFVESNRMAVFILYGVFLIFSLWIFTPFKSAQRIMLTVIGTLPGSYRMVHSLDSARICSMLASFLRQGMPLNDAFHTAAQLVESSVLQDALEQSARRIASGGNCAEIISREKAIDNLIVLTFRHTPENELPVELKRLSELFEHRVTLAAKTATVTWTFISIIVITFVTALVVMAMFSPLISIIRMMGS